MTEHKEEECGFVRVPVVVRTWELTSINIYPSKQLVFCNLRVRGLHTVNSLQPTLFASGMCLTRDAWVAIMAL